MRLVVLLAVAGCSYVNVKGPPTAYPGQEVELDCTITTTVPELDVGGAIGSALLGSFGTYRLAVGSHYEGVFLAPLLFVGVLDAISAYYGFRDVRRCKAAIVYQDDMRQRQLHDEAEQTRQKARAEARELTTQAEADARVDACPDVFRAARAIEKLDAEFYRTVFLASALIQHCLNPSSKYVAPPDI